MLRDFKQLIGELQAENSSNGKKEILRKYPQCKPLLEVALNPYKKFHITSDQLEKHKDIIAEHSCYSGLDLFEDLASGEISGHKAIAECNAFISFSNQEYKDLILRVLSKDLKCRTGATLINSVYPGLIPEFQVALAETLDMGKKIDLETDEWYYSRKLDGCRCICRIEKGEITFYSRTGHEFTTLDNLKADLEAMGIDDCVLDGEICLMDREDREDFQLVMKEIRKKDHTIRNPRYLVFDYLTLEEFDSGKGSADWNHSARQCRFADIKSKSGEVDWPQSFKQLVQQKVKDVGHISTLMDEATARGYEGLIIRKNVAYEGKRTKNMLKVKKFKDAEYKVVAVHTGLIDDGQGNKVEGMVSVDIKHRGNKVTVGSGWTYKQRILYMNCPDGIIGKILTIQYFSETRNKDGKYSLRFPVVKHLHSSGKREV